MAVILIIVMLVFAVVKLGGGKTDSAFWGQVWDFGRTCIQAANMPTEIKPVEKKPVVEKALNNPIPKAGYCHNCINFERMKAKIGGLGNCKLKKEVTSFRDGCEKWRLNPYRKNKKSDRDRNNYL